MTGGTFQHVLLLHRLPLASGAWCPLHTLTPATTTVVAAAVVVVVDDDAVVVVADVGTRQGALFGWWFPPTWVSSGCSSSRRRWRQVATLRRLAAGSLTDDALAAARGLAGLLLDSPERQGGNLHLGLLQGRGNPFQVGVTAGHNPVETSLGGGH